MDFLFGDTPDPPKAPNPEALAKAQAQANRVDVYSPLGNVNSGPNRNRLDLNLSPEQLALLGGQQAMQGTMLGRGLDLAGSLPGEPLDFEGLPGWTTGLDTEGLPGLVGGDDVTGALFESTRSLLQPGFDLDRRRTESMLNARGLPITGEAYTGEMDRLGRSQGETLNRAALGATVAGADVAGRNRGQLFGEMGTNADLQNRGRQQGISERMGLRGNQFQELAALLSGSPVQMPDFSPPAAVDVLTPASMQYNSQLAAYNQGQQNQRSTLGGLFDLGTSALGFFGGS